MSDVEPVNGIDDRLHVDEFAEEDQSDHERRLVICEGPAVTNGGASGSGLAIPVTPTRNGPIQNRTYSCTHCPQGFTTTSARAYLFHMKEVHNDTSPIYTCDVCEYATKYKQKLPRHRKLHFDGQDNSRTVMSQDINDSRSSGNIGDRMVEPEDDDDLPEVEAMEEEMEESGNFSMSQVEPPRRKGTRQEVDPAKYFEVKDDDTTKFACSTCGNMYKWRKSLNKHWKEKHAHDEPDNSSRPRGMEILIQQNSIRQTGNRRAVKIGPSTQTTSPNQGRDSGGSTPVGSLESQFSSLQALTPGLLSLMPYNDQSSSQPVFPGDHGMLFLGNHPMFPGTLTPASETPRDLERSEPQGGPLDLSNKATEVTADTMKREPEWDGPSADPAPPQQSPASTATPGGRAPRQSPLACDLCSYVGKTSVDYGNHIRTVHNNKKECKCASCGSHFETPEELTEHFGLVHFQEIVVYKEMIQKIPHGLQQTYHLISMPLDDIAALSAEDLNGSAPEARPLKCNICDHEAKWPADLQKHAASHSDERPFACMVCGSTYKWKWDLVKHFEKSHEGLPNPYKRKDNSSSKTEDAGFEEAGTKEHPAESPNSSSSPLNHPQAGGSMADGSQMLSASSLMVAEAQPSTSRAAANDELDDMELGSIRIPNVQSMITDVDRDSSSDQQQQRPITAKTHKAVSEAVRQRINFNAVQARSSPSSSSSSQRQPGSGNNPQLTQSCPMCDYKARWPSEITQHMKNHSNEKPHGCPLCSYRSKWKWDVVKHLKRCGNINGKGHTYTINDVIDYSRRPVSGPPNVTINLQGVISAPAGSQASPAATAVAVSVHPNAQPVVVNASSSVQGDVSLMAPSSGSEGGSAPKPGPTSEQLAAPSPAANSVPSLRSSTSSSSSSSTGQRGQNACDQCSFAASSQAELRRHAAVHSNEKPWVCRMCDYGTRWKCDLKKHITNYNHQCPENEELLGQPNPVQTCPHCTFKTSHRRTFEEHARTHSSEQPEQEGEAAAPGSSSPMGRYFCNVCPDSFEDVGEYLAHIQDHYKNLAPREEAPTQHDAVDAQRMKHPRKTMKIFRCDMCSFVTNKEEKLKEHSGTHVITTCPYCEVRVLQKNLLAHASFHEEFNRDEWQVYINRFASESHVREFQASFASKQVPETFEERAEAAAVEERRTTPTGAVKRSRKILSCQYCTRDYDNVLELYNHCQEEHDDEIRKIQEQTRLLCRTPTPPGSQNSGTLRLQPTPSPGRAINLSSSLGGGQTPSEGKKRVYQCIRCVFNSPCPSTYLLHVEHHNSKSKYPCWHCDYSIDSKKLLFLHMKQVHPGELRESGQVGAALLDGSSGQSPSSPTSSTPASSSDQEEPAEMEVVEASYEEAEETSAAKAAVVAPVIPAGAASKPPAPSSSSFSSSSSMPVAVVGQATYKGVPVEVVTVDGQRRFKCLQCPFLSPDLPATARHVQQQQHHGDQQQQQQQASWRWPCTPNP